ncbi:metallophosphatase family protein [Cryobacterium lactosi]|uniref:Metallophosphatase family protein n=1 Tax=Cryobacterium lactosi TaxID=1259202 RepID=A0A4R9BZM1_9MICO|nr:metallophosphoesterase [Cryobacterium lactosi]TFD94008.1 metallophosphatase family protein [Cryobacterium lactosi]
MTSIPDLSLTGETQVAVAGDWHANIGWVQQVFPFLRRAVPGIRTVLHLGDFGYWGERSGHGFPETVSYWARAAGIERVLVTPGNHEHWSSLDSLFAVSPNRPVQIAERVHVLPRAFRFTLAGRTFASFGGAASLDRDDRVPLKTWWPSEVPTEADVTRAIDGGPTEVLLTHEAVDGGTELVERILRSNPLGWDEAAIAYSALSRERVTRVYEALRPRVLAHGHLHLKDERTSKDGRKIYSLGADGQDGNLAVLRLEDLRWTWLGDPRAWKRERSKL